jgi:hypothetical protein
MVFERNVRVPRNSTSGLVLDEPDLLVEVGLCDKGRLHRLIDRSHDGAEVNSVSGSDLDARLMRVHWRSRPRRKAPSLRLSFSAPPPGLMVFHHAGLKHQAAISVDVA